MLYYYGGKWVGSIDIEKKTFQKKSVHYEVVREWLNDMIRRQGQLERELIWQSKRRPGERLLKKKRRMFYSVVPEPGKKYVLQKWFPAPDVIIYVWLKKNLNEPRVYYVTTFDCLERKHGDIRRFHTKPEAEGEARRRYDNIRDKVE